LPPAAVISSLKLLQALNAARQQQHDVTFGGEQAGDAFADAARCAGDENNPA
jgi:hypothetical protein